MAVIAAYGGTTLEYDDSVSDTSSDDAANQEANTNKFISDIQHGLSQPGFKNLATNISGIFGLPYQFSADVDPTIYENGVDTHIGRKYNSKIFSIMPILFLSPGEPKFMADYGNNKYKSIRQTTAAKLAGMLDLDQDETELDDGRYYSFESNFPEYKKYANASLRALALYMGIDQVEIPIPGGSGNIRLGKMDIERFLNSGFSKFFGSQVTVPFFLDAENSISESFSNSTTESTLSQTVNQYSQNAREIQFIMGSKDFGGLAGNIQQATTDVSQAVTDAIGGLSEAFAGKSMISR